MSLRNNYVMEKSMSHSKRGIISIYENGANKNMALQWQKKYLSTAWNTFISSTVQVNSFVNFKNDSYRLPYLLRVMNKDQRNWRHIYYLDNAIFQLFKIKFKVFQITYDILRIFLRKRPKAPPPERSSF